MILRAALPALGDALPPEELITLEFESLLAAFERLPGQTERDPDLISERRRDQKVAKARLADLLDRSPEIRSAVEGAVRSFNGTPGDARSFDPLDALLEAQSYRLAFWRVAAEEINYRRFFAINELAAIRQEEPAVFAATHQLLLELIGNGSVDGVRIDHPTVSGIRPAICATFSALRSAPATGPSGSGTGRHRMRRRTGPLRMARSPAGGTLNGPPVRSAIASSRSTWSSRRSSRTANRCRPTGRRTARSATTS